MGSSHGYACVYLLWYLLLPVMQIFQKHCTDKQLLYMLGIMTVGLIGTHTLSVVTGFSQNVSLMSNDLLLFVYIYYFMVWFRRKNTDWKKLRIPALIMFIITWGIMGAALALRQLIPENQIIAILSGFVFNERSIFNIIAGLALFVLAMGWKIPYNKIINFLAASTFGVLLYHDHNYFRNVVWQGIIRPERLFEVSLPIYLIDIIVCSITIFAIGVIVDVFRRKCVEKLVMRSIPKHILVKMQALVVAVFDDE